METSPHIGGGAHPTPKTYVIIAALLAIITAIEVYIFYIEALKDVLIPLFIVLSMVKFAMVAMFYMHLKFDERLFSVFFVGGLLLATAVILALMTLFALLPDRPSSGTAAESQSGHGETVVDTHGETTPSDTAHTDASPDVPTLEIGPVADSLMFNSETLTVSSGAEVVLRFTNSATTQQHNWVLVQDGAKDEIAMAGLTAGAANDWVPEDTRIIAQTRLIAPGESGDVSFTAPSAGTYQFVCTFPGHGATMFGSFQVNP